MSHYAIHTRHLTRNFNEIRAVDELTLNVPRGIVFGFLGPNGSGKTTTIRLLLGLLEPTSGAGRVLGYDVATEAAQIRASTGALMEHNGLYERLTATDNLEFYGRIYRMPKAERQARIKQLLTHMNLWERRNEMVRDWSKGMRQKLAVARALLHRPPLVILDEPTSGLDPVAAAALRDDLAGLVAAEGITVFLNTHNLPEAEKLCQQVGVIRQGKLVKVGSVDELRQQEKPRLEIVGHNFSQGLLSSLRAYPEVTSVQRTSANGSQHLLLELAHPVDSAQFVSAVVNAGGQIEEVKRTQSSLEDVFLSLVKDETNETAEV
jgi:ABC-2 type transport system ATP-binding protein